MYRHVWLLVGLFLLAPLTLRADTTVDPETMWQTAQQAMTDNKWDDAANEWTSLLDHAGPSFPRAKFDEATIYCAQSLCELGKYAPAKERLLNLLEGDTTPLRQENALELLTVIACKEGDAKKIDTALTRLLDDLTLKPPHLGDLLNKLAVKVHNSRPLAEALQRYLQVHPAHPYRAALAVTAAHHFLLAGDSKTALALLRQQLQVTTDPAQIVALAEILVADKALLKGDDPGQDILTTAACLPKKQ